MSFIYFEIFKIRFGAIAMPYLKYNKLNESESRNVPFAVFNSDSKEIEIHLFASEWSKKLDKENKKFNKLIKHILLTF